MSIISNIRLGLLHMAVAISFVAINGVLNRVMIHDLGILATLSAALVVMPYLFSPMQMWIGQYSDTHPIWGYHRTPYIVLGVLLTVGGMVLSPHAALMLAENLGLGILLGLLAFGMWGMGYNLAVVSYLSLASDMSTDAQRSRTIAVMWFMMITSIIITAVLLGRALEPYSNAALIRVFGQAGIVILLVAGVALAGLEPRRTQRPTEERAGQRETVQAIIGNPQARRFFIYLMLLLVAILGQDILLEPFGAHAFNMTVEETTQLTALWGGTTLVALLAYGFLLNRWMTKKQGAALGAVIAISGFVLIAMSGSLGMEVLFKPGIGLLGFGTGISTSTNLGLMLDMTTAAQAGLFIGAWGVADAMSRGIGMMLGGSVRDLVTLATGSVTSGYVVVFLIEAGFLVVSLHLLRNIDVSAFRERRNGVVELAALADA